MIRTCPLMGYTYSRLGATLGSPKLRLLSLLSHFCPLSPLYSPCSLGSYPSTCPFSPACCCVPRPFQLLGGPVPPPIPSPSAFARTLGRSPSFQNRSRNPRLPEGSITPVTRVALLRGTSILAVTQRAGIASFKTTGSLSR